MNFYYFNDSTDEHGKHEVHGDDCKHLPEPRNRTLIGYCLNCKDAIQRAKREYPFKSFDGCYWCSRACHTG